MSVPWHTGRVASAGEDIYFEVIGTAGAPAVMLTHGAGGNHAVWWQQLPALVDAGYRVVTWDARGFGNSSYNTGVHGAVAAVADMEAVLAETDAGDVHLVGQSMGGWWVVAFTIAHPQRVRSLTLCNTVGGLWTDALTAHFRSPRATPESGIGTHPALGPKTDPARAFLYQQLNTFHDPPMRDIGRALLGTHVAPEDLDATGVPVLLVTGSDDALFPSELTRDSIGRLRNAEIVTIDGAGHSAYFEHPDEFNAALLSHFASTRDSSR